jgi:hypothetical protein
MGLAACAQALQESKPSPLSPASSVFRIHADATVKGAHLFPEIPEPGAPFGVDEAGEVRTIGAGVRQLRYPDGRLRASETRFSTSPLAYALPLRLGGGFLYSLPGGRSGHDSSALFFSDTWLSAPRPIWSSPRGVSIADVIIGLDRVYVRAPDGAHAAIDSGTGRVLDGGAWPSGPSVASYRALDGWVAAAIVDLRGALGTFDAGATWKPLVLPDQAVPQMVDVARTDPRTGELSIVLPGENAAGDFLVVKAAESSRQVETCYAVRPDATVAKLLSCPKPQALSRPDSSDWARKTPFGDRPILAAVEDGWPLDGETALVARDGTLGRVRLSDGAWIRINLDAFPSRHARCHPLPILVDEGAPGLGFACADPWGSTLLYAYDPERFVLTNVRSFESHRSILSYGNGALAIRGGCGGDDSHSAYCVLSRAEGTRAPRWTEVDLPNGSSELARVLVFDDGHVGVLYPPALSEGDANGLEGGPCARLVFAGGRAGSFIDVKLPELDPQIERSLKGGVWLDGFEERSPGRMGGWVEASGTMIGIELDEQGTLRVGQYVLDAGSPIVSGRYGLGWTRSRRAYETTDGGMTWTTFDVPDPLSLPGERACGPVGCTAAGWIRVGWGKSSGALVTSPEPRGIARRARLPDLALDCVIPPTRQSGAEDFFGASPGAPHDDVKLSVDALALDPIDRAPRSVPWARLYAWGPRDDEWEHQGHWAVRWLSPYASSRDVRTSAVSIAPFSSIESARAALGIQQPGSGLYSVVGEDMRSSLLVGRRQATEWTVTVLEADQRPAEIRRSSGETFPQVLSAVQTSGVWYLATAEGYGEPPATVVYRVDGERVRELARLPRAVAAPSRAGFESHKAAVRLAHRSDGSSIGLIIDGPGAIDNPGLLRWVLPIDVDTGEVGEPENLGEADLNDRDKMTPCSERDGGWIVDAPWAGEAHVCSRSSSGMGVLTRLYMRATLTSSSVCLNRLSGTFEPNLSLISMTACAPAHGPDHARDRAAPFSVSVLRGGRRSAWVCRER